MSRSFIQRAALIGREPNLYTAINCLSGSGPVHNRCSYHGNRAMCQTDETYKAFGNAAITMHKEPVFNIQSSMCILNLAITRFRIQAHCIYQTNKAMRQRFKCI